MLVPMFDLLLNIQKALAAEAWYLALMGALTLPDICGAMEQANGIASPDNYKQWFNTWIGPKYKRTLDGVQVSYLDGKECYAFRCALLHQGRTGQNAAPIRYIAFAPPTAAHYNVHMNKSRRPPGMVIIDLRIFCNDMDDGVQAWAKSKERDPITGRNHGAMIRLHPNGLPEAAISGFPMIG